MPLSDREIKILIPIPVKDSTVQVAGLKILLLMLYKFQVHAKLLKT